VTYIPANTRGETVAVPAGLAVIPSATSASGQTLVTGNRVNLGSATALEGSWTPSISGNIITLAAGYYYYLEASQQGYHVGSILTTGFLETQWYDETSSANIGTIGLLHMTVYEDAADTSYDEVACAFVDATSAAVDVSVKIGNFSIVDTINNTSAQNIYAGYGRQLIWRLDP
jgi:hypothetical protein